MSKSTKSYSQPAIGCYLDQANYNNDELSYEICQVAINHGWNIKRVKGATALLRQHEENEGADSEALNELSEDAISWLNEQETRPFMYWANEGEAGAFGLWPNVDGAKEDVGFTSSKRNEYPENDYEGEWLHVSDHGNATLYVRTKGVDKEVWSVV